jgi:hypothetical protein
MKIIKAHKSKDGHLYLMVDDIPKITYEKVGLSYVGSDDKGYFNDYLKYEYAYGNMRAFAGREINLDMKDGTVTTIKDHWWDAGFYDKKHEYIGVGLGTLEKLQDCFVFCSYYIRKDKLEAMLEEYLKDNSFYDYWDIEKWCKLQYNWYPLIFHGKQLPFLMNYKGHIVNAVTMEYKYAQHNLCKIKKNKWFELKLFKLQYKENDRLIKLEDNYINVVKETLPNEEFEKYILLKK